MKKSGIRILLVMLLAMTISVGAHAQKANRKRPPRPERIVEQIPERTNPYHVWQEGRWKWKKKENQWVWKDGYWRWPRQNEFFDPGGFYGYGFVYGYGFYGGFHPAFFANRFYPYSRFRRFRVWY